MTPSTGPAIHLGSSFASTLPELALAWEAEVASDPELLVLNGPLAAELGLNPAWLRSPGGVQLLLGHDLPAGAKPVAPAYAGHQFGGYSPRLGDGRALLLGELVDAEGRLRDLHLKGSGRTPFARGGDGLAAVGPMLREYVVSEAMHALGVPTTRSLAVVATGRPVHRETVLPGALLTRVAESHLRVGSFQYARATGDLDLLRRLADHAIERHHPDELAIEAQFFGKNVQSMLKLGRAQGVAIAAALQRELAVSEYAPKRIKQSITGNGNASKEQVAAMLLSILHVPRRPASTDATDAVAVAVCHHFCANGRGLRAGGGGGKGWGAFLRNNPQRVL